MTQLVNIDTCSTTAAADGTDGSHLAKLLGLSKLCGFCELTKFFVKIEDGSQLFSKFDFRSLKFTDAFLRSHTEYKEFIIELYAIIAME